MAIQKIITVPNPLLRQKSKKVAKVDKKIHKVIVDLLETVKNASEPAGLGLSAIQIGQQFRIFVAKTKKDFEVFINPQTVKVSKETLKKVLKKEQQFFEGCLSVPQIYGFVDRPYEIKLEWLDEKDQKHSRNFTNRDSVCLQHELDHLEGILFIDRLLKQKSSPNGSPRGEAGEAGKIFELKKDKKGKEVFEEVEL